MTFLIEGPWLGIFFGLSLQKTTGKTSWNSWFGPGIVSKIQFQGVYFLIVLSVNFQTPSTVLRPDVSQEKPEYPQIVNFSESSTATEDFGDWRITLPKTNMAMENGPGIFDGIFHCHLSLLDVSKNSGTPKSSHFNRVFHYKSSILGYHYFWKHPTGVYRSNEIIAIFPDDIKVNSWVQSSAEVLPFLHGVSRRMGMDHDGPYNSYNGSMISYIFSPNSQCFSLLRWIPFPVRFILYTFKQPNDQTTTTCRAKHASRLQFHGYPPSISHVSRLVVVVWVWDVLPDFRTRQRREIAQTTQQLLLMEEIRLTTWDIWNLVKNGINHLSTGAGFLPSIASPMFSCYFGQIWLDALFLGQETKTGTTPSWQLANTDIIGIFSHICCKCHDFYPLLIPCRILQIVFLAQRNPICNTSLDTNPLWIPTLLRHFFGDLTRECWGFLFAPNKGLIHGSQLGDPIHRIISY